MNNPDVTHIYSNSRSILSNRTVTNIVRDYYINKAVLSKVGNIRMLAADYSARPIRSNIVNRYVCATKNFDTYQLRQRRPLYDWLCLVLFQYRCVIVVPVLEP